MFDITTLDCTVDELVGGIIDKLGMPCLLQSAARVAEGKMLTQKPGTKFAIIERMLLRPEGSTLAEMLEAVGWPSITMVGQAETLGIVLNKTREGRGFRYFGHRPS